MHIGIYELLLLTNKCFKRRLGENNVCINYGALCYKSVRIISWVRYQSIVIGGRSHPTTHQFNFALVRLGMNSYKP